MKRSTPLQRRNQAARLLAPTPLLVALSLAWPAGAALAQTTTATPAGQLSTVTVTAERREENIKDVPSTISTLAGEALDVLNSGGQDLRALSGRVPSLNIESSFGRAFPRFYIRGYGNTDFRLNASQPVSLIYDDIVQENPILKGFPAFDLSRIEVLYGPQGTLFGRNTPGGVVKFESVKPSNKKTDGYASFSYGTYGTMNAETGFNLPLSGDWSMRVSALAQHRDNWVTNTVNNAKDLEGYDDRAVRIQAAYEPKGGDFSALMNIHSRDLKGSPRLFRADIIKKGSNELVDNFDPARVSFDATKYSQNLTTTGGSVKLKWSLKDFNLYSVTGYESVRAFSRADIDGSAGPYNFQFGCTVACEGVEFDIETSDGIKDHSQITQEFRVESKNSGPLNWQAGLYVFDEKYSFDAIDYNPFVGGINTTKQTNTSWATFGSLKYELSRDLSLRAGLRYTQDKKELSTAVITGAINTDNGTAFAADDNKTTWDLSASYKLTPDATAFTRVATGYRGTSIQPASGFGALTWAKPESVLSYEAGVKADLWAKTARTALSVFSYTVKDQQLTVVGGANNVTQLVSAKEAVGQGVEWSFDAYLSERLRVGVSASYNDTKINDPSLSADPCPRCNVTVLNTTNGPSSARIDGNPLPMAPKWIANLTARYSIPTASGEYYLYTDWAYRSDANPLLVKTVEFTVPPLLEGGLRAGYIWADGKYEIAAFGRNITNEVKNVYVVAINNRTGMINDPRTFGVQFKATF